MAQSAVMYFIVKSCIHTVRPPETLQKYAVFEPLLPASTKFRKIPQKRRNSAETGKFCGSAQNSACRRKLWWSLLMLVKVVIQ